MINNSLTQLLELVSNQPATQKNFVQNVPGKGQQNVQSAPTVNEEVANGVKSALIKAASQQAVDAALPSDNTEKTTQSETAQPSIKDKAVAGALANAGSVSDPVVNTTTADADYVSALQQQAQNSSPAFSYNPYGGFSSTSGLREAGKTAVKHKDIQDAVALTNLFEADPTTGQLLVKNGSGTPTRVPWGTDNTPTRYSLNKAKELLQNTSQEDIDAALGKPINTANNSASPAAASYGRTPEEEEARQANNALYQQRSALAKALFNSEPSDQEKKLAEKRRQINNGVLDLMDLEAMAQGKPSPYGNTNLTAAGDAVKKEEDVLGNSPRMQTLKQVQSSLAKNEIPTIETMDKVRDDVIAQRNDLVGKVTKAGYLLGSADDIAYAMDNQNLSEQAVAKDILAELGNIGDTPGLDQVGIAHILKKARQNYPNLQPATIGMVLKGYLQTSKQADVLSPGDGDISENLSYRDGEFANALKELSTSKTQGYKQIETLFYNARKDLKELLSLETQYDLYNTAYNRVLSDQKFFRDPKYEGVKKYLQDNNQKAFDAAKAFADKASVIFKNLEEKNKTISDSKSDSESKTESEAKPQFPSQSGYRSKYIFG